MKMDEIKNVASKLDELVFKYVNEHSENPEKIKELKDFLECGFGLIVKLP